MCRMSRIGTTWVLAAALAACSSSNGDGSSSSPQGGDDCGGRGETFSAGMTKTGEQGMSFTLVSADPAPPQQYTNVWIIELKEPSGAPLTAGTVTAKPWMPDHNHGSPKPIVVTELGEGRYELNPVSLSMPGLWETMIEATTSDGIIDRVVSAFCI